MSGAATHHAYVPVAVGMTEGVPLRLPFCSCGWRWDWPVPVETAARMWAEHAGTVDAK